ncbi:MAG: magnesium/cobalt efflux protein [Gammaproteobacteria bacterium]|nr:MAG: magnesium/cobalt efflux protein [Gammaproteobacteria bacterium]
MNDKKEKTNWLASCLATWKKKFYKVKDEKAFLLHQVRDAQRKGVINLDSLMMIEGVFQVSEMRVRDIMVPRSHLVVVQEDLGVEDMLAIVASSGHSRFPVVDESLDEVVGILLAKDLAQYHDEKSRKTFELNDILRPAVFVPESKRLNVLLKDFRESRNHMAMVIDEYSGVAGVVTIEDVLEQIVGEIDDEHDAADVTNIRRSGFQRYSVRGVTSLDEFNQYFDCQLKHTKFETIAGLVTFELGHLPERGEEATIDDFHFKIVSANSRRINNMQVSLVSENEMVTEPVNKDEVKQKAEVINDETSVNDR